MRRAGSAMVASTHDSDGAGSSAAALAGTISHNQYATCAPATRLSGTRSKPTTSTETLAAIVSTTSENSAWLIIAQTLDQHLELGDVLLGQLLVFAEMRHERRNASPKQSIDQPFALAGQPLLPRQHRRIDVAAPVFLGADRTFLQEPVEERLDGRFLPLPLARKRGHDLLSRARARPPQHGQHHRFRVTDRYRSLHRLGSVKRSRPPLWQRLRHPEPQHIVPIVGGVSLPRRRTHQPRRVSPRPAPIYPETAGSPHLGRAPIRRRAGVGLGITILVPLPDIADHIV